MPSWLRSRRWGGESWIAFWIPLTREQLQPATPLCRIIIQKILTGQALDKYYMGNTKRVGRELKRCQITLLAGLNWTKDKRSLMFWSNWTTVNDWTAMVMWKHWQSLNKNAPINKSTRLCNFFGIVDPKFIWIRTQTYRESH